MLSQSRRIPRSLFPLLKQKTKIFQNKLFFVKIVPYNNKARFCFSVSKKVAKNAVVRNRLRRLGYSYLARYLPEIKAKNLVWFSFKNNTGTRENIDQELKLILKESNLIK